MSDARILVVEDDAIVASHLERILGQMGYEVTRLVATGEDAITASGEDSPDVVLMDVRLRGAMNGVQAAREIRSRLAVPVIFLTAYADEPLIQEAKETEPYGYLAKPVRDKELRASIEMARYKHATDRRLKRLNEVLRAVRDVNQLIARERDHVRLLQGACRILVGARGYALVTIRASVCGNPFEPIAEGPAMAFLEAMRDLDDDSRRLLPCAQVLEEGARRILSDLSRDLPSARLRQEALSLGIGSMAGIPMRHDRRLCGALCVYGEGSDLFDDEEIELLEDLAADLAFALRSLEDEAARHTAEAALIASEARYRDLVENLADIVYTVDRAGVISYVSPAITVMAGYEPAEVTGRRFTEFMHEDDRPRLSRAYRRALSGRLSPDEFRFYTKTGDVRWARLTSRPIVEKGVRVGLRGTLTDITERKEAVAKVLRLAQVVEQAAESIILTSRDGTIQYVNAFFERLTGYSRHEAIGQTPRLLQSGATDATVYAALWHTLLAGDPWAGRLVNRRKDGSLYWEEKIISPFRDSCGEVVGFISAGHDVSREVELEGQLRRAQRLEALGQLAGGIAHDFNNVLQTIVGYLSLALGSAPAGSALFDDLKEIERASQRASGLTRQLLAFSRRQEMELKLHDINELISALLKMLRRVLGEHIVVDLSARSGLSSVEIDAGQLEQVVLNLALNARDAMPDGGRLSLRTDKITLGPDYLATHPWAREGDFVVLRVVDTGTGMTDEVKTQAFEPFFTTKEEGRGTGLGLAMVYGIMKQHKGFVDIESTVGRGTTVSLYLPCMACSGSKEAPAARRAPSRGGHETILMAEDEAAIRALNARILGKAGYRVLPAATGDEAVAVFDAHTDAVDLALLDVVMPGRGGLAVYEHIRIRRPGLPVLFASGYSEDIAQTRAIQQEGFALLRKPFAPQDLLQGVRAALDAARPAAPGEVGLP